VYEIRPLVCSEVERYKLFTFPKDRDTLHQTCLEDNAVVLAALWLGQPAGLLVARARSDLGRGIIVSVFVSEMYRNTGLGTALVKEAEQYLRKKGCQSLAITFPNEPEHSSALLGIMEKCGWGEPRKSHEILKYKVALPLWMQKLSFRDSDRAVPWNDISSKMLVDVKNSLDGWYSQRVSPFRNDVYAPASFWFLADDKIAGWLVTRRNGDILVYNTCYVRKEFQGTGRFLPVLTQAVKKQLELAIPYACHRIEYIPNVPNTYLLRFHKKHLKPLACLVRGYYQAVKIL
jgi:GNAT superfamily N-acetyltransferase